MKKYRVILDTSILVAASRSGLGASFALLQALKNRHYRALVSVPLMLEYEAVLKRPQHFFLVPTLQRGNTFFGEGSMPEICRFYGIIIRMYLIDKEHPPPHIHVKYGEYEAVM